MVLTSPRLATLNRLYQGAIAARACASVRLCAEAAEAPVSMAAARERRANFVMAFPGGWLEKARLVIPKGSDLAGWGGIAFTWYVGCHTYYEGRHTDLQLIF